MGLQKEENRSYPRFPCQFKVQVQVSRYCAVDMIAIDVSLWGLRVKSLSNGIYINVNSDVEITIERQFNLPYLHFSGSIKHELSFNDCTVYGVHITSFDIDTQSHWNTLVSTVRENQAKNQPEF